MLGLSGGASLRPLIAFVLALGLCGLTAAASAQDAERGAYIAKAAGCISCHTDYENGGAAYAGGRGLETPFGTFYSPNITSDRATGIGGWSEADLRRALREGVGPRGKHYFPVFPYTSYTGLTDGDIADLYAFLQALPAVERTNADHDVPFPVDVRLAQYFWKLLFLEQGPLEDDPAQGAEWNRGRYLVHAAAHCGECHTPRNVLGAPDEDMFLAGTPDGPEGERAPNITPDPATGIGSWTQGDIVNLLKTGFKPDFDNVQGSMEEVIEHGLKELTDADLNAIAAYLKSLPPIANDVPRR